MCLIKYEYFIYFIILIDRLNDVKLIFLSSSYFFLLIMTISMDVFII